MVTKMKMFGFMPPRANASKSNANANAVKANPTTSSSSSSNFNMKNLASTMNLKNTGCKSCRG